MQGTRNLGDYLATDSKSVVTGRTSRSVNVAQICPDDTQQGQSYIRGTGTLLLHYLVSNHGTDMLIAQSKKFRACFFASFENLIS